MIASEEHDLNDHEETSLPYSQMVNQCNKVEGICHLLQSAKISNEEICLILQKGQFRHKLRDKIASIDMETSKSLDDYIVGEKTPFKITDVKRKERFALAVILAHAVLQYCDGPWCQKIWHTKEIHFYQQRDVPVPDFRRPYLSTCCSKSNSKAGADTIQESVHPYPIFFALGCLLLELELGCKVTYENLHLACEDIEGSLGNGFEKYLGVINACINYLTFLPGKSLKDESFLEQVYATIVAPLESELYDSFHKMRGQLSHHSTSSDVLSSQTIDTLFSRADTPGLSEGNIKAPPLKTIIPNIREQSQSIHVETLNVQGVEMLESTHSKKE